MKECGSCTLCCKLMGVVELNKPTDKWCVHCKPGRGCTIYENRPPTCVEFKCLWLAVDALSDEMKPDRIHVVIWPVPTDVDVLAFRDKPTETFPRADVIVQEDPGYYTLGQSRERIPALMRLFANHGWSVCFINGKQRKMVIPAGRTQDGR